MQVCNHEETLILVLHPDIILYRPEIIPQVQVPGTSDTAHHYLFLSFFHKQGKNKEQGTRYKAQERLKDQESHKKQGKIQRMSPSLPCLSFFFSLVLLS